MKWNYFQASASESGTKAGRQRLQILHAFCLTLCLAAALCGCSKNRTSEISQTAPTAIEVAGTANPFTECRDIDEAAKLAGFDLSVPSLDKVQGIMEKEVKNLTMDSYSIQVIQDALIQVSYYDKSGKEILMIRKGAGKEDISGDYQEYRNTAEVKIGKNQKANIFSDQGRVCLTTWTKGDYSFAVETQGNPVSVNAAQELAKAVK